jgi:spermidine synthase
MKVVEIIEEPVAPGLCRTIRVDGVSTEVTTPYQRVVIGSTVTFGKVLFVDDSLQSTECDEAIYHQSLVWPTMLAISKNVTALVAGGGEGATARELLRFQSVIGIDVVDIDSDLVAACRSFLRYPGVPASDNVRVQHHYVDILRYLEESPKTYDVIVLDLPDPEDNPHIASMIRSGRLFGAIERALAPDGVISMHVGSGTFPSNWPGEMMRQFSGINLNAKLYGRSIPSFGYWLFCVAARTPRLLERIASASEADLSKLPLVPALPVFDSETHRHMFSIPADVRERVATGRVVEEIASTTGVVLGVRCAATLMGVPIGMLSNAEAVLACLVRVATEAALNVVNTVYHQFQPAGATCLLLLKESHIAFHSWPEHGAAHLDVFTCGDSDPREVVMTIAHAMCAQEVSLRLFREQCNSRPFVG